MHKIVTTATRNDDGSVTCVGTVDGREAFRYTARSVQHAQLIESEARWTEMLSADFVQEFIYE